jgi:4-hydroxy-2-oxoheptanedioate aldolase
MVETPGAVEQAAEIAAVDGIDAVFVGPNDLAHAMGHENRWADPPVQAAIERALRAVSGQGKCAGVLALTPEEEERYAAWGGRYFASVTTALITRAFQQAARQGRAELNY